MSKELTAEQATTPEGKDAFDYIIVGSGPGGGPLAARLALAGKKVLVIEAGRDPRHAPAPPSYPKAETGEIHEVPGYHAASTEDKSMAWMFSVRHYADDEMQKKDEKYNKNFDPNTPMGSATNSIPNRFLDTPTSGKQGIFYPRSAGLGGCTGHHAMIMAVPNDRDWEEIANLTGDDTWRASQMRGYFTKLERCEYLDAYGKWFRQFLGFFFVLWQRLVLLINPRAILDKGGHGTSGWQPTNFIDPDLVQSIAHTDRAFFNVLTKTAISVLEKNRPLVGLLKRALFQFRVIEYLDPNDYNTRRTKPEGVFLIPAGISNRARTGLREHLLKTREDLEKDHPSGGKLVIEEGVHVTHVLFKKGENGEPPRAIGVKGFKGDHLYAASASHDEKTKDPTPIQYFTSGEVILSGGAFNTPQLLMVSGIGEAGHLLENGIDGIQYWDTELNEAVPSSTIVDLPGVGKNLQDRYEVTVISELDKEFETLKKDKISFVPGDEEDEGAKNWRKNREGLYGTNGGTIAILRRSSALSEDEKEPDTFSFGAPAAFRGYYWGWSHELLKRTIGATDIQRNLWSWVILKAYTDNNAGTVKLRSNDPFATPEICFHSFDEGGTAGANKDLRAMADTVKFFREVNARNARQFANEIQPGAGLVNDSPELDEWIKTQAWGHHACGTCRIGSDAWTPNPQNLADKGAVLDSEFRVHGVKNLRVVDASVFPRIPGYFILTPIMMVSEKAADTILRDSRESVYPAQLREKEAAAIRQRRLKARVPVPTAGAAKELPEDTVGLALSGGGIRSATFGLGLLQGLAERGKLRNIDILSTVSGGGFIGSFWGRLFTRKMVKKSADPAGRVEDLLKIPSAPLLWLRQHANYIFNAGKTDIRQNLGLYLRNTLSIHLIAGIMLFGVFGLLGFAGDWIDQNWPEGLRITKTLFGLPLSTWWWLPAILGLGGVVPLVLGYWLAPKVGSKLVHPAFPVMAWGLSIAGAVALSALPGMLIPSGLLVLTMLLSWLWQEAARWDSPAKVQLQGVVVRNRLTRSLGDVLTLFLIATGWVLIDTIAHSAAKEDGIRMTVMSLAGALVPLLPIFRWIGEKASKQLTDKTGNTGAFAIRAGEIMGFVLAIFLLFAWDLFAHWVIRVNPEHGIWSVLFALAFSLCFGRAFDFLNLSTLQTSYSARLTRTFQGASNEARLFGSHDQNSGDVQLAHPEDDIAFQNYHPEEHGGPLHLINLCVNESVDAASQREVRERKGLSMTLGPAGVTVGRRQHALWTIPKDLSWIQHLRRKIEGLPISTTSSTALAPIIPNNDPNAFHVLANRNGKTAPVESLSLGNWIGVSGAAFSTGIGRGTREGLSLFMGIINVRLGYWWDSGIDDGDRPGQYPASLWQRIRQLPFSLFRMHTLLFSEWRGRFFGPAARLWHLSDGGHFENTGLYELIRRRVPFCIATDSGMDSAYKWEDIARLARQVRQDFNVDITWLDPRKSREKGVEGWAAFDGEIPSWIKAWLDPKAIGALDDIYSKSNGRGTVGAALARVRHGVIKSPFANQTQAALAPLEAIEPEPRMKKSARVDIDLQPAPETWILLFKATLTGSECQDVKSYASMHPEFPQDSTYDQVFDDEQWESYRALGQHMAREVFADNP